MDLPPAGAAADADPAGAPPLAHPARAGVARHVGDRGAQPDPRPYAVYARRVLGLRALDPLRPEPSAAERGTVLHDIMDQFLKGLPDLPEAPELMAARLLEITDRVLDEKVPWPSARLFWRARIAGVAQRLMTDEAARLTQGRPAVVETRAELPVPGVDFRLTAKPDRLDLLAGGRGAGL